MTAYYNEIDPFAAAWLRELIKAGLIAPGDVDERSIEDVTPMDLRGYTKCHFFAGIGGWSYALRLAGWPDDRPVWTGSCPCQPFSSAGKGNGFADERHLWPAWFWLIGECHPGVVFGEQVSSPAGLAWFDVVSADLESQGYAVGAVDCCAAGVGAPHIRQRLWFVADAERGGSGPAGKRSGVHGICGERQDDSMPPTESGLHGSVAESRRDGRRSRWAKQPGQVGGAAPESTSGLGILAHPSDGNGGSGEHGAKAGTGPDGLGRRGFASRGSFGLADAGGPRSQVRPESDLRTAGRWEEGRKPGESSSVGRLAHAKRPELGKATEGRQVDGDRANAGWAEKAGRCQLDRPTNGHWADAEWLPCRDGKARPVEPGSPPLAHGIPGRVGRLRGYGNSIVPQVAAEVVRAYLEALQ